MPGQRVIPLNGKIELTFRYCTVKVGELLEEEIQFPVLNPNTENERVMSLVFDAKGLHNDFITEIELLRDQRTYSMYVIPQRNELEIETFRKLLAA